MGLDKNGYAPSIIHDEEWCYFCGQYGCVRHEVFYGTGRRTKSKRLGLWLTICPDCHTESDLSVHKNRKMDLELKAFAQRRAMDFYGWAEEEFIKEFGCNYIFDDAKGVDEK